MEIIRSAGIVLFTAMVFGSVLPAVSDAGPASPNGYDAPSIFDGIVRNQARSLEITTAELRTASRDSGAIIFDARPFGEYAVSHIPGALAVPGKAGTTPALYVADVNDILSRIPDKGQALVLYCNGLFCGRSERFADEPISAGYRNVHRYQLGAPGWRAFGGVMQVEKTALLRQLVLDRTSVLIDGRTRRA